MTSRRPLAILFGLALSFLAAPARGDVLVNFDDLSFAQPNPPLDSLPAGSTGSFDNGFDLGGGFTSHGASFNNDYGSFTFGNVTTDFWSGWAFSNVHDTTPTNAPLPVSNPTPVPTDFLHQYAAIPGSAPGGSGIYAVADAGDSPNSAQTAFINLPAGTIPKSFDVTNTVYTYLSVVQGDSIPGSVMVPGDFLELRIFGFSGANATGSVVGEVDTFLADYRNGVESILMTWRNVDLSSLANSQSLGFEVDGAPDQYTNIGGTNFLNAPSYFAMDDLLLGTAAVPEPSSLALIGLGLAGLAALLRARRRGGLRNA